MTALTLYYAPGTCAQAVRIALEEAQAPHALVRVDFASQQQRTPEYLAVNPKGRVPALVTEQGTLTETPALLVYVAQRFPAARRPLGRRARGPGGDAAQGAGKHEGMLRAHREPLPR